jgi:hypothetical protein
LKAAELHGATHQAVMEFQVVTDKRIPKIHAGRSIISFVYRKDITSIAPAIVDHKTDTGRMKISSPELTALDLLRYAHVAGSLDSIASVLSDLGAKLRDAPLVALAPAFERSVLQRLGYLLDFVKQADCANMLHDHLQKSRPLPWVELEPHRRRARSKPVIERNARWNLIVHRKPARRMIPAMNIVAWGRTVPWVEQRQVEQDLVMARALVETPSCGHCCKGRREGTLLISLTPMQSSAILIMRASLRFSANILPPPSRSSRARKPRNACLQNSRNRHFWRMCGHCWRRKKL